VGPTPPGWTSSEVPEEAVGSHSRTGWPPLLVGMPYDSFGRKRVRYLYGDSTPSPLQSNFLAFLRDALSFCVHLLQARDRIIGLHADGRALDSAAEEERARIAGLRVLVVEAAESANTNGPDSASQRAVTRVRSAAEQGIATTLAEVAATLASAHAALDARERAERDGCLAAVGELLAAHEPHDGTWAVNVELGGSGYAGECRATTPYGIAWTCALEFAEGHPMAGPMKAGDMVHQLELVLPEPGGFLKKGKVRPQRVDQYSIDAFSANAREAKISLRVTPRAPIGLDITIVKDAVEMVRAGAKDHAALEVSHDDTQKLLTLRDKLLEAVTVRDGLRRRANEATMDNKPLDHTPDLRDVVTRVIEAAAPIANEIQAHSLTPRELVIRRLLGNDRREEIFVTTSSLLDKLTPLTDEQRTAFSPLQLKRVRARTPRPDEAEPEEEEEAIVRTRIRPITPVALPIYQPPGGAVVAPAAAAPAVEVAPASEPDPAPVVSVSSSSIVLPVDDGSDPSGGEVVIDARNKDALASTVKRIVGTARAGRATQAYGAYAALFEDPAFAQQRPQDQRQVLKLMVMAKTLPPQTPMVVEAYRRAMSRLKALTEEAADPVDSELISACQTIIDRPSI